MENVEAKILLDFPIHKDGQVPPDVLVVDKDQKVPVIDIPISSDREYLGKGI